MVEVEKERCGKQKAPWAYWILHIKIKMSRKAIVRLQRKRSAMLNCFVGQVVLEAMVLSTLRITWTILPIGYIFTVGSKSGSKFDPQSNIPGTKP